MSIELITIHGRTGIVQYMDATWQPVAKDKATLASVTFDDGGHAFYTIDASPLRAASRDDTAIHHAADAHFSKFLVAAKYILAAGRAAVNKTALRRATTAQQAAAAMRGVAAAVHAAVLDVMPQTVQTALADGGHAGIEILKSVKQRAAGDLRSLAKPLRMRFDPNNPNAAAWAAEHAGELAKNLSESTTQAIQDAVEASFGEDGNLETAYEDILSAIGDEDRADLIARSESMIAASEGQRQSWDQAVDSGLLTGDEKRVWIATSDACDECMNLDGEETDLNGEYSGDGGDGPPLHPRCRCSEGIV